MQGETIDLASLSTAELLDGPCVTHMRQCYNWTMKMAPYIWETKDEKAYAAFGELQISMANMFRDMAEVAERFRALVVFM